MATENYQGWTNKETWALALHIDNSPGLYEEAQEVVWDYRDRPIYDLANGFKRWVEEMFESFWEGENKSLAPVVRDVGSLWRVNWEELAEHYREE